jgi:DNA-binding MarR family transcriptional regulator
MDQDEEKFYAKRGQWLDYLVCRRDLHHGVFRVAYFIASKINPKDECMWWGVAKIAEELQVSIRTVTAAIDKLSQHETGLLVVTKGAHGSNRYFMRMPKDPADAAFKAMPLKREKTGGRKRRVSKNETR